MVKVPNNKVIAIVRSREDETMVFIEDIHSVD